MCVCVYHIYISVFFCSIQEHTLGIFEIIIPYTKPKQEMGLSLKCFTF